MELSECTTVQEVEALRCTECSNSGHWGWCDAPWIKCTYRDKIKEILGNTDYAITDIRAHVDDILQRQATDKKEE